MARLAASAAYKERKVIHTDDAQNAFNALRRSALLPDQQRKSGLRFLLSATLIMESHLQSSILISKMVSEFSESFGVLKAPEWVVPMLQLVSA